MMSNRQIAQPAVPTNPLEFELKYTIPSHKTKMAIALLSRRLDPDPRFPTGIVSSIYFDSLNWTLLGEKRNSDFLKSKVRLRWYSSIVGETASHNDPAFAEIKYKIGSRRVKYRCRMNFTGRQLLEMPLNSLDLRAVPHELQKAGYEIKEAIEPAFVVSYKRKRYIDRTTGRRVCIDFDIGVPRVNQAILCPSHSHSLSSTVIEVKSQDQEFPLFLRPLQVLGLRKTAFSKYYECYAQLTKTTF